MCQRPVDRRSYCERLRELQERYNRITRDNAPYYIGNDRARIRYGRKRHTEADSVYLAGKY